MRSSLLTDDDRALRPTGAVRSPWLREALEVEGATHDAPGADAPPLARDDGCDVAIVGGGYTGLWTALELRRRDPSLRVTLLEADICGAGPSGRNGGFVNAWWDELSTLIELFGEEGALAAGRASSESVAAIGAWCERNGVDAHYRRGGMAVVSTTPLHDGRWTADTAAAERLGQADAYRELSPAAVARICASPRFRGGALMRDGATVHPGHLVRGLRRVALAEGVEIHEGTRLVGLGGVGQRDGGPSLRVRSPGGVFILRAAHVVLAMNAWLAGWRPFRRRLLAWSSYMVRSEPAAERIARELGWTGGTSIVDARASVRYLHVTREGRVAIGAGGGRPGYGGRIGDSFTNDVAAARRAAVGFRWLFPQLADLRLTDAWGGPIDVSPDHLPYFGSLPGGRVHFAYGYSGNGVGPSHLAGRVLASLVLGAREEWSALPLVGPRATPRFPPEPFRYLGARLLREAMVRREDGEEAGQRAPWWLRELTRVPRRLGYHLGPGA